jgi:Domain of unknown function (DUF4398)
MQSFKTISFLTVACAVGCGASYPPPTQRMADAMSAERSAEEVGAKTDPRAGLHLKLAEEQITRAKDLIANGDNRLAEFALVRAKSDAELALALSRASSAKDEASRAVAQAESLRTENAQRAPNPTVLPPANQGVTQ